MSTLEDLPAINHALDSVHTAAQARAAIGTALNAIHASYDVVGLYIKTSSLQAFYNDSLTQARMNLESWYATIASDGNDDYTATWATKRRYVEAAYNEIAGVEGAASYKPKTSNLTILIQSIQEAPGLFAGTVGEVLGNIANTAGNVAGKALGGLGTGLGLGGIALVAGVALIAFVVIKKTNPLAGIL